MPGHNTAVKWIPGVFQVEALHALKKKYFNSLITFSSDHISQSQYNALQHTIWRVSWIVVPANTDWIWTADAKTAQYKLHFWRMWRKLCPDVFFIAFLRHFRFCMAICNVPRWNELEILIPKHMWKGSYPKSIEALIIGGTKNRKAQR